ncbi:hypothetical protein BLNAU_20331 [Blattamonas nauphoetae]|uniref:Uncharacterized protein n=1 Tax=Blattamonas nauphoetae TaxID=2049346 RepID=A0ABQ9WZ53_9EUKA|nr:hypothetical protein BLNAU_20331 [Blattamonas nauphoetae]
MQTFQDLTQPVKRTASQNQEEDESSDEMDEQMLYFLYPSLFLSNRNSRVEEPEEEFEEEFDEDFETEGGQSEMHIDEPTTDTLFGLHSTNPIIIPSQTHRTSHITNTRPNFQRTKVNPGSVLKITLPPSSFPQSDIIDTITPASRAPMSRKRHLLLSDVIDTTIHTSIKSTVEPSVIVPPPQYQPTGVSKFILSMLKETILGDTEFNPEDALLLNQTSEEHNEFPLDHRDPILPYHQYDKQRFAEQIAQEQEEDEFDNDEVEGMIRDEDSPDDTLLNLLSEQFGSSISPPKDDPELDYMAMSFSDP